MPVQDKAARYALIKSEHAQRLEKYEIVLHCYECEQAHKAYRPYTFDRGETVQFYPKQDEPFWQLVRRAGPEVSQRLRKLLERPERCRLLCQMHIDRAEHGWTFLREDRRRLWPDVGYLDGPVEVDTSIGTRAINDEYRCGTLLASEQREEFKVWREEWLNEPGTPPAYDGGWWVCASGLGPRPTKREFDTAMEEAIKQATRSGS